MSRTVGGCHVTNRGHGNRHRQGVHHIHGLDPVSTGERPGKGMAVWCPISVVCSLALMACREDDMAPAEVGEGGAHAIVQGDTDGDPSNVNPSKRSAPKIFARRFVANVRVEPNRRSERIGYLRAGAVLRAIRAEATKGPGCFRGWHELTTGGWVCVKRDVTPFEGKRLPEVRALQPSVESLLPYPYGFARPARTPVFRRLPSVQERQVHDRGPELPDGETPGDGGAANKARGPGIGTADGANGSGGLDAGVVEVDAGPPTLASLEVQDESGLLLRHMVRGFCVSLDREFEVGRYRYWRTQQNEYIPFESLRLARGTEFEGVGDPGGVTLPMAWVMSGRHRRHVPARNGAVRPKDKPGYHHRFSVRGSKDKRSGTWLAGDDGYLYRPRDVTVARASARPSGVPKGAKWIDVDLGSQTLVAYEGDTPVYTTAVSTGRVKNEHVEELNHETPAGLFQIRAKHLTATMDGDNAFDGPYSIQDVPYVMYYELGYALHGAFWHNRFGRPKSHGCVNLAPNDAKHLFFWSDPPLPEGWHGVYPHGDQPVTFLRIRGRTPRG